MKPEEIIKFEAMHADVQAIADKALGLACLATQMARHTARQLAEYQNSQPLDTDALSEDLREWLPRYHEIGSLPFAEQFNESKPRHVRRALRLLDIIPTN